MSYTSVFKKLKRSVSKTYLGKKVPYKYRKRYGVKYDKSELLPLSYSIAKSRGLKIDMGKRWR